MARNCYGKYHYVINEIFYFNSARGDAPGFFFGWSRCPMKPLNIFFNSNFDDDEKLRSQLSLGSGCRAQSAIKNDMCVFICFRFLCIAPIFILSMPVSSFYLAAPMATSGRVLKPKKKSSEKLKTYKFFSFHMIKIF